MFLGHYDHTIDDKGRLTIPVRFREQLAEGAYVTLGFDGNLIVMTKKQFDLLAEGVKKLNLVDPAVRALSRQFFAYAQEIETDRVGRILITEFLRKQACLETNAVVAGMGDYFEIWQPELWSKQDEMVHDPAAAAQRFAALSLSL